MSTPTGPQEPQFASPGQPAYGQDGQSGYAAPQGYGAQGQAAYGQYAQPQNGATGPSLPQGQGRGNYAPTAIVRPPAMNRAVMTMRIGAVLSVVSALVAFLERDAYRDILRKTATDTGVDVDTLVNSVLGGAVFGALVGAALWLWMAWANGKGRSWARIVGTVFFVIAVLQTIYGFMQGQSPVLSLVLSIVDLLVGAAATYFMWQKESSRFYEESSRTS